MSAADRVRRHRKQLAVLDRLEIDRDLVARRRLADFARDGDALKALDVELEERERRRQQELEQLIAEQQADDTYFVDRHEGEISLDAPAPSGEGTIGDLVGRDEDGRMVDATPRERGGSASYIPTHDKPGKPPSKPLSTFSRLTIQLRIEAETAALQASDPTMSPKQARRLAIGGLCPRPTLDALKQATGEPESNLSRWRRENGRNIPRRIEECRRAASKAAGKYPGRYEGIKREIRNIAKGVAVAWPFPHSDVRQSKETTPVYTTIPNDAEMASDAAQLAQTALELSAMALRFQARFPTSIAVADAVERFLEAALLVGE